MTYVKDKVLTVEAEGNEYVFNYKSGIELHGVTMNYDREVLIVGVAIDENSKDVIPMLWNEDGKVYTGDVKYNLSRYEQLKLCPFCGNKPIMVFTDGYHAICDYTNNGCGASGGKRATPLEAKEAWNKRPE